VVGLSVAIIFNGLAWYFFNNLWTAAADLKAQRQGHWPEAPCTVTAKPTTNAKGGRKRVSTHVRLTVNNFNYSVTAYNTIRGTYTADTGQHEEFALKYDALVGVVHGAACHYDPTTCGARESQCLGVVLELQTDEAKERMLFTIAMAVGVVAGIPGMLCMYKALGLWGCVPAKAAGRQLDVPARGGKQQEQDVLSGLSRPGNPLHGSTGGSQSALPGPPARGRAATGEGALAEASPAESTLIAPGGKADVAVLFRGKGWVRSYSGGSSEISNKWIASQKAGAGKAQGGGGGKRAPRREGEGAEGRPVGRRRRRSRSRRQRQRQRAGWKLKTGRKRKWKRGCRTALAAACLLGQTAFI
jgi:hypothetical protein